MTVEKVPPDLMPPILCEHPPLSGGLCPHTAEHWCRQCQINLCELHVLVHMHNHPTVPRSR